MRTRILLADNRALVHQGFRAMLAAVPEFEVVGEAGDGRAALERTRQLLQLVVEGRSSAEIAKAVFLSQER